MLILRYAMIIPFLLVSLATVRAESEHEDIVRALGLASTPDGGTEVRVWLESNARVNALYRITKAENGVSTERFAFTRVVHPESGGYTVREARRETRINRRLLKEERCSGAPAETPDYLWCRVALQSSALWPVLFDDLLLSELWNLPARPPPNCGSVIFVDGETVTIDLLESGRRHSVSYWSPDVCCPTVACAIADHVRNVVENIY